MPQHPAARPGSHLGAVFQLGLFFMHKEHGFYTCTSVHLLLALHLSLFYTHTHSHTRTPTFSQGIDEGPDGLKLISDIIREKMGMDVSVLMGANIANEVAAEKFCETTIGKEGPCAQTGFVFF